MFADITKENLHHAYLIEGDARVLVEPLLEHLSKTLGIPKNGNPNVHEILVEMLDIETARKIRQAAGMTPFGGGRSVFIIGARSMGVEAQNALLKTLEEPGEGSILFLIVPTREILLPTVRSRVLELRGTVSESSAEDVALAKRFIEGGAVERLFLAQKIHKEEDKDVARDKAKAFLAALIGEYGRREDRDAHYLERLITARRFLYSRSPSLKLILEGLAVTYPRKVPAVRKG
jgi:hypothetical protein